MKNYKKMTSAALKKELETANAEESAAIQEVLTARGIQIEPTETPAEEPITEVPAAEEKKAEKHILTDEELNELKEKFKADVNHRCKVVPFNTIEWVEGYVTGLVVDKKSRKILYAIKTDDGRRIVKATDSKLVKVFEEKREVTARSYNAAAKMTEEEFNAKYDEMLKIVGGKVTIDDNEGRITGIVKNLKALKLLYVVKLDNGKTSYKSHNTDFSNAEMDEEATEMNTKYISRLPKPMTIEEKVAASEEKIKKLETQLEAEKTKLEELKKQAEAELLG